MRTSILNVNIVKFPKSRSNTIYRDGQPRDQLSRTAIDKTKRLALQQPFLVQRVTTHMRIATRPQVEFGYITRG